MEIEFTKASTDQELHQILELQKKNAIATLSTEEKEREGFITVIHSFDILKQMNDICPHIIAKYNNEVVGYALSMDSCFGEDIPVLAPMFKEIKEQNIGNYLVMGRVCVDINHRKKGVFRELYAKMSREYRTIYDSIITEVDSKNTRSLNAHFAIGFELLLTYESLGQHWNIIVLPTR